MTTQSGTKEGQHRPPPSPPSSSSSSTPSSSATTTAAPPSPADDAFAAGSILPDTHQPTSDAPEGFGEQIYSRVRPSIPGLSLTTIDIDEVEREEDKMDKDKDKEMKDDVDMETEVVGDVEGGEKQQD